ncbi:MAG TPA: hypothetical protein VFE15_01605 [Marmoricola sp.]|nr:hypothetical protein [Marmoricola sp.]
MTESNEQHFVKIIEDLSGEYAGTLGADAVHAAVAKYRTELEPAARITDFIPVLVRRYAREELQLAAGRESAIAV